MVFNIVGRNQDDHVKNIGFLMNKRGAWSLAPAYDFTFSFSPTERWTSSHQMTVNGKLDGSTREDRRAAAATAGLTRGHADAILANVVAVVGRFDEYADRADVSATLSEVVRANLRLVLPAK
jgi:serine/threonine-protein kinase HipA